MAIGRPVTPANDRRGGGQETTVAVLSYDFWQRHFGGDPEVLGRTLTLNRVPYTVIGVTTARFMGPLIGRSFDVAVPLGTTPSDRQGRTRTGSTAGPPGGSRSWRA